MPSVAGEGAATGAELYVGHGTVWVNGDNGYIAMQVSGLEVLPGAGLTDSGNRKTRERVVGCLNVVGNSCGKEKMPRCHMSPQEIG